ncbi:MAG: hypothetical protein WC679_00935 [Bacteroidales bacterium]|jgi:hypothetical protein
MAIFTVFERKNDNVKVFNYYNLLFDYVEFHNIFLDYPCTIPLTIENLSNELEWRNEAFLYTRRDELWYAKIQKHRQ